MTLQLAIEIYALLSLTCLACVVALFLKACWPETEVRTMARPQLHALLESPLRADSSVRNVAPVSDAEWAELDAVIGALVREEPLPEFPIKPPTLARMKPASKRVM